MTYRPMRGYVPLRRGRASVRAPGYQPQTPKACIVVREGVDEKRCRSCTLRWSIDDPNPPPCPRTGKAPE